VKKSSKVAHDPRKLFVHACRFHESDHRLRNSISNKDNPNEVDLIAQPAMVLSAFASELYLKCLICIETGEAPRGHDLKGLFLRLGPLTRKRIEDLWDEDRRRPHNQKQLNFIRGLPEGDRLQPDLLFIIGTSAKAFEELRYIYETEFPRFLLGEFPNILHRVILEKHPEWGFLPPAEHVVRLP
jgi:hypothetical protein